MFTSTTETLSAAPPAGCVRVVVRRPEGAPEEVDLYGEAGFFRPDRLDGLVESLREHCVRFDADPINGPIATQYVVEDGELIFEIIVGTDPPPTR